VLHHALGNLAGNVQTDAEASFPFPADRGNGSNSRSIATVDIGLLQLHRDAAAQPYTAGCPRIVFSREYDAEEDSLRAISFFDALACMGGDPDVASLLKGRLETRVTTPCERMKAVRIDGKRLRFSPEVFAKKSRKGRSLNDDGGKD
jgi:hypothetical protein